MNNSSFLKNAYFVIASMCMLLITHVSFSQVQNPGFEQFIPNNGYSPSIPGYPYTNTQPLEHGCSPGWYPSHGTPEIGQLTSNSSKFVHMWTRQEVANGQITGEGVYTECQFKQGIKYYYSIQFATDPSSANILIGNKIGLVSISLVNGLEPSTYANNYFGYNNRWQNLDRMFIQEYPNLNHSVWNGFFTISGSFIPNKDYSQLYIYPYGPVYPNPNGARPEYYLFMDNVSITTCDDIEIFTNSPLPHSTQTSDYITAKDNVTITSGQVVDFTAGKYISLLPGTSIESGAYFTAEIRPCPNRTCENIGTARQSSAFFEEMNSNEIVQKTLFEPEIQLSIYPNPSNGSFTIEARPGLAYRLFDSQGIESHSGRIINGKEIINTKRLKKGLYFLHCQYENQIEKRQIIIE